MDLQTVKNYLRVDFTEDDSYIQSLIDVSELYLYTLTKKVDKTSYLYRELSLEGQEVKTFNTQQLKLSETYRLALINEMYDNRGLTIDKAQEKVRAIYSSILMHLMYS